MYVVTYVRDEGSGEAFIYLRGPGEGHYGQSRGGENPKALFGRQVFKENRDRNEN